MPELVELRATRLGLVQVHASPEELDRVAVPGTTRCRIAPDEELLVADHSATKEAADEVRRLLADDEAKALVLDVTDGWAVWTLSGELRLDAFARLSALALPSSGFVQGEVARVPAKVLVEPGHVHILVSSAVEDAVRALIEERCAPIRVEGAPT